MDAMTALHGTAIVYKGPESLAGIPRRHALLDAARVAAVDAAIAAPGQEGDGLLFLPNSVKEFHEKDANGALSYRLLAFGILPDGRKTGVVIEGVTPYFDIRKPLDMAATAFRKKVHAILSEQYRGSYLKEHAANGFDEYEPVPYAYIRAYFPNLWDRKRAMKYFNDTLEWKTANDDDTHVERIACRDHPFSWCAWNTIKKFKSYGAEPSCRLPRTFRMDVRDLVEYAGDIASKRWLSHDKTMVVTWDIEAYSSTGEMPNPDVAEDEAFAIGKTYHWKDDARSFLDVVFISRPCDARPDKLTVLCQSEKDMIKAAFVLDGILRPDFCLGFNDGDFDWPFIIGKATRYKILIFLKEHLTLFNDSRTDKMSRRQHTESILQWDVVKKQVKLEAGTVAFSTTLTLPGYINIDVRTMFRKLYPTEPKSSLKFFLALSNLGGKEDMDIHVMFQIYRDSLAIEAEMRAMIKGGDATQIEDVYRRRVANKARMADVAHYCTIDAKRCQDLMQKMAIISDKREVSNVSHTTLYDALYFADGMKVRNLVMAEAAERGLVLSTRQKPYIGDGQYPGAYVFPPVKGPVKPKLSVRERKATDPAWSAVPEEDLASMERAMFERWGECNGVDEKGDALSNPRFTALVADCTDRDALAHLAPVFTYSKSRGLFKEFVREENKYPVSGLDFSSLYPSIIMTYNLSPEYMVFTEEKARECEAAGHTLHKIDFEFNGAPIIAWSIRHDTYDGVTLHPGKTVNKFGLYPSVLKKLFDKRSTIKKEMKKSAARKEAMEKDGLQDTEEYSSVCFQYNYLNSKQKALKVFMNTFYGETGNKQSPNFVMAIAGGITTAGQRNIKATAALVCRAGCKLYYGDTDSCYISCPAKFFVDLDRRYYGGRMSKEEYCTALVRETFVQIGVIKDLANASLIADNGTWFLTLAYEEVLYPALLLMKKMYAGVEHQSIVNFAPHAEELFTKGMAHKKRGVSEILKTVCMEVLVAVLDIHNTRLIEDIVGEKIANVYTRAWGMGDFLKSAVYKPSKNNVPVRAFCDRMKERGDPACPVPAPGERFNYVVVKKYPFTYDMQGRKTTIGVGDKWEYRGYAEEHKLEIDLDYYMTGGIIGQFAQFVAYHPRFQVVPADGTPEAYDLAEKKTLMAARKHIEALCKAMTVDAICQGPILKTLYRIANKSYSSTVQRVLGNDSHSKVLSRQYSGSTELFEYMREELRASAEKTAIYYADQYVTHMRKKYGRAVVHVLWTIFTNAQEPLLKYRTMYIARIEDRARQKFAENARSIMALFESRTGIIEDMIGAMKGKLDLPENWMTGCAIPDPGTFESDAKISDIVNSSSAAEGVYEAKVAAQKGAIETLKGIYDTLASATTYLENTRAIVGRLRFCIDKERQENPQPPGVTDEDEQRRATEFSKRHLIDF